MLAIVQIVIAPYYNVYKFGLKLRMSQMYETNIFAKNYSSNPTNTIVTKYHSSSTTDYKRPVSKHNFQTGIHDNLVSIF